MCRKPLVVIIYGIIIQIDAVKETGILTAPDFDNDGHYDNDLSWMYKIRVPDNRRIRYYFTHMDIEEHEICEYDRVMIYDEDDIGARVYCGEVQPPMFTSTARAVFVEFVVTGRAKIRSFAAVYAMIDKDEACGGILTEAEELLQSPDRDGDGKYENDENSCVWAVVAPEGSVIELEFHHFDLEEVAFCAFDYVEIYDGSYTARGAKLRYCGSRTPPPYRSAENKVFFLFRTDYSVTYTGFNITFKHL